MYQVLYKRTSQDNSYYYDYIFFQSIEETTNFVDRIKIHPKVSDIQIISNAVENTYANKEIQRLRKLLSNAYIELQQLKKDYNSYIKKIHGPKLLLVVNVSEDEVLFYVKEKDNSVVEVKIPKEDFHSPACVLDFDDIEIIDNGLTVRFGQFECAVEDILEYQYQPEEFVDDEESS